MRRLGFGAMRLRREPGRGVEVLRRAGELGANLIDTADIYGAGTSEELIAEALHPYPDGVVIATKGGLTYDPDVPLEESVGALAELRDEGKLRLVGLSNVGVEQLRRAQAVTPIATVQNEYNRGLTVSEDVLRACEADGIGFMPWRPLGDGYAGDAAGELRWLLDRSPVMLPIPGTASVEHLEENMRADAA